MTGWPRAASAASRGVRGEDEPTTKPSVSSAKECVRPDRGPGSPPQRGGPREDGPTFEPVLRLAKKVGSSGFEPEASGPEPPRLPSYPTNPGCRCGRCGSPYLGVSGSASRAPAALRERSCTNVCRVPRAGSRERRTGTWASASRDAPRPIFASSPPRALPAKPAEAGRRLLVGTRPTSRTSRFSAQE